MPKPLPAELTHSLFLNPNKSNPRVLCCATAVTLGFRQAYLVLCRVTVVTVRAPLRTASRMASHANAPPPSTTTSCSTALNSES